MAGVEMKGCTMINGLYDVAVDTPKYHKRGTLELKSEGADIKAKLCLSDLDPFEFQGTCEDKEFSFQGAGEFGRLGQVEYHATGSIWGNSIDASAETSAGKVTVFGTQLSASAGGVKSSHEYMMRASTGNFDPGDNTMYSGLFADGG